MNIVFINARIVSMQKAGGIIFKTMHLSSWKRALLAK